VDSASLVSGWVRALGDERVVHALEAVHLVIADQVALGRPRCDSSGRCCNFRSWGHRLYTTGLEAAYVLSRLGETGWGVGGRHLTGGDVDRAVARGDCPFLVDTSCGVHGVKPGACRIYFCDPGAEAWMGDLSEATVRMIRRVHEAHAIEYRYGEWRELLRLFAQA
jgi:Fe-S-cluster containining protein